MFGRLLGWYTIYTFSEALASNGILLGAKFTLRPSLVRSPILAALLDGTRAVDISRTLPPSAEGATYIRQGGHHAGHILVRLSYLVFIYLFIYLFIKAKGHKGHLHRSKNY